VQYCTTTLPDTLWRPIDVVGIDTVMDEFWDIQLNAGNPGNHQEVCIASIGFMTGLDF
jgi:hypothetical protein